MPADNRRLSYFADTNLLLYSLDLRSPEKRARAAEWMDYLWASGCGRISWQVVNEFYVNAVRKIGLPAKEARQVVTLFSKWKPGGVSMETVQQAWHWMDQAQLTYWDALIIASAERQGCAVVLSEDFQAGRRYGGVEVISPFKEPPPARSS